MERKDIEKVYNGDAMVFHKKKFWTAVILAVVGQLLGMFVVVVVWGARVDEKMKNQEVHMKDFVPREVLEGKFESMEQRQKLFEELLNTKFEYIKRQLEEIKNADKN